MSWRHWLIFCVQEVILVNILTMITNGGTAGMFWGFIIVGVGYTLVYLSLAEMAAMVCKSKSFGASNN